MNTNKSEKILKITMIGAVFATYCVLNTTAFLEARKNFQYYQSYSERNTSQIISATKRQVKANVYGEEGIIAYVAPVVCFPGEYAAYAEGTAMVGLKKLVNNYFQR
jgi:hypothetical protein